MTVNVLTIQGRLAEHFGDPNGELASDKKARIMGKWRAAEAKAAALDGRTAELLQAYADGVNAYLDARAGSLGPLFDTSTVEPQRWTVAHCLAAWHELADGFSIGALGEAANRDAFDTDVATLGLDGAVAKWLGDIRPGISEHGIVQLSDADAAYVRAVQAYADSLGIGDGNSAAMYRMQGEEGPRFSHAFALADWRTTTGGAMMMADPQLPVLLPSIFWEYQVSSPSFSVRGGATPGTPALAVGQSDAVAWGITAGAGDQADLFRLVDGPKDDQYVLDGVVHDMTVEREVIEIAGGSPLTVTYRQSQWGPVVTDLLTNPTAEYALKTLLLSDDDTDTAVGMIGMMEADDLKAFVGSLDDWRSPNVNLVAATAAGEIYYSLIGGIPVRSHDSPLGGWVAQDGDVSTSDWLDVIPHTFMPQVSNPASGTLYSGNHRPAGDWYPLPLALPINAGGHSHRSARLRDQLDNDRIFDPDTFLSEVQNDCVDSSRQRFVSFALHAFDQAPETLSPDAEYILSTLEAWADHGSMATDVPETLVVSKLLVSFRESETGPELQEQYGTSEPGMINFLDLMEREIAGDPSFVPDAEVLVYLDLILARALDEEVEAGSWIETWTADNAVLELLYHGDLDHMVFAPPYSVTTDVLPCASKSTIWSQTAQTYSHFVDFGSGRRGSVKAPGTSEDRHEDSAFSELELWTQGELKPAPVDAEEVKAIAVSTETLTYTP